MTEGIAERLAALRREIEEEVLACGRPPGSVRLLGVSKKQPVEAIVEAARAGLDAIGENYVQEAKSKFAQLPERGVALEKHFIGHLQTNKAKALVELFDVVQSVDRVDAALALGAAAAKAERSLRVLIQLNISPEDRFGAAPSDVPRIAEAIASQSALRLDGIMAIGPITADRGEIQRAFETAAKTFALLGGNTLSIGMSGDWREAIAAGSTMVRIGTALFGERVYE